MSQETIERINQKATEEGLSNGKYVAREWEKEQKKKKLKEERMRALGRTSQDED